MCKRPVEPVGFDGAGMGADFMVPDGRLGVRPATSDREAVLEVRRAMRRGA